MEEKTSGQTRRNFLQTTALAGMSLKLAGPDNILAKRKNTITQNMKVNIKTRGYAGKNTTNKIAAWSFERRAVGDDDILIILAAVSLLTSCSSTPRVDPPVDGGAPTELSPDGGEVSKTCSVDA